MVCLAACGFITGTTIAQTLPTTTKAPVAYSNTVAILAMDCAKIQIPSSLTKSTNPSVAHLAGGLQAAFDWMDGLSSGHTAYVSVDIPYGSKHPPVRVVLRKGTNAAEFWKTKKLGSLRAESDGCLVITFQEYVPFVPGSDLSASQATQLQAAESTVQDFPVRCVIMPPEYFMDTLEQTLPKLPEKLGGLPTSVLTRGVRWAAIGFDPNTFKLQGTIQSSSAQDAQAFAEVLPVLLQNSIQFAPEYQRPWIEAVAAETLSKVQWNVQDDQIQVSMPTLNEAIAQQVLAAVAKSVADPVASSANINKLRAIQLAILNYESAFGCFPPDAKARGENGQSGLSWRVHILPFLGNKKAADVWKKFNLDEPWDSEHNKALIAEIPEVYQAPSSWIQDHFDNRADRPAPGLTQFLAPQGEGTILGQNEVIYIRDVKDGTSKTLTVVKVKPELAQPWTAPTDYQFDPKDPAEGLEFDRLGIGRGVTCDGAVHTLKKDWPAETFRRLFDRDDGQPVQFE